jgi:replication-associated recombination protein RarA
MPLYGYNDIISTLKNLADTKRLSHAYAFFGEPQIGKFLCAHSFANYVEYGLFEEPTKPLQETLIIDIGTTQKNEEESVESIGIMAVRNIIAFVRQKPVNSLYRIVIVRDAEWLTDQAQNALLKILEEPPEGSVIIFIVTDPSVLLPAVASRVQRIYFKTLSEIEINEYAKKVFNPDTAVANKGSHKTLHKRPVDTGVDFSNGSAIIRDVNIVQNSFGRIGRLRNLHSVSARDEAIGRILVSIQKSAHNDGAREKIVDTILAFSQKNPENLIHFFEALMIFLRNKKNYVAIAEVVRLIRITQTITLSKRIHLKKLLCLIT